MSFGLAALLLWTVKRSGATDPSLWVQQMGSPLLLVPNDITFLAVLAPFTFVLLYREPCTRVGVGAALSLLVSLWAICVLQSRVAVLTMITSLLCTAVCIRPRLGLLGGVLFLFLALGIDGLYGFPLVAKWTQVQDARLFLWWAAWAMFRDAPLLGHGPHTFVLRYQSYMPQSPLPAWLPVDTRLVSWAHNLYLETLAEQGIIGAAALGWLLTCGVVAAWKTQRAPPEDVRLFGASALGGLCGICLAAALELSLVRHWVAVTLFLLLGVIARVLALAQQHTDNKKEETT
jgi:O-antigen ligase